MLSIDVTSWRDVMTWYHLTNTWTLTFREWATRKTVAAMPIKLRMNYNMSKNGLKIIICNLIAIKLKLWSYEKNTQGGTTPPASQLHWNNNIFELSDLKNYGNKKRINFLAHLEAEIGKSGFVTSWHDVMTSQYHTNKKLITYLKSIPWKFLEWLYNVIWVFQITSIIFWLKAIVLYTRSIYYAIMVPTCNSLSFRRFSELESCLAFCMHPPLGGDIYLRRTELESTLFWTNLKNSTCTLQMVHLSMICAALLMIDYSIK